MFTFMVNYIIFRISTIFLTINKKMKKLKIIILIIVWFIISISYINADFDFSACDGVYVDGIYQHCPSFTIWKLNEVKSKTLNWDKHLFFRTSNNKMVLFEKGLEEVGRNILNHSSSHMDYKDFFKNKENNTVILFENGWIEEKDWINWFIEEANNRKYFLLNEILDNELINDTIHWILSVYCKADKIFFKNNYNIWFNLDFYTVPRAERDSLMDELHFDHSIRDSLMDELHFDHSIYPKHNLDYSVLDLKNDLQKEIKTCDNFNKMFWIKEIIKKENKSWFQKIIDFFKHLKEKLEF